MSLDYFVIRNPRQVLKSINVLSVDSPEDPLLVEETEELVSGCWRQSRREQFSYETIERQGILSEIASLEHRLRIGKVVFPKFEIQTSRGRAEVRNASICGYPSSTHDHDVLEFSFFQSLQQGSF